MQTSNREALLLPDKITPYDNLDLPPPPDASWLLSQIDDVTATPVARKGRANNRDINLQEDFDNSQFLHTKDGMDDDALAPMADLDLDLDLGLDFDEPTMEVGRDAPMARGVEDDVFSDIDMATTLKPGADMTDLGNDIRIADGDGDLAMGDDDFQFNPADGTGLPDMSSLGRLNRARISESPLSDVDEDAVKQIESSFGAGRDMYEPQDDQSTTVVRRPAQRSRKQKILQPDDEIALSSSHIKQQQADRNNITKEAAFLPRDPVLLALMDMQRNGGFVSSIMLEGRSAAWAPELRGMLTLDALRGDLKRKRDSGVADLDDDHNKSPRLEFGDDTDLGFDVNGIANQSMADGTIMEIPADDGLFGDDGAEREGSPMPNFDETTMPIVHPADSGPVSLGTKHAVHILRDLFGDEAAADDEKRKKATVVFQDLLPEKQTTKAEATKMFFECLVLATKDAIKVEQGADLGDPIRVRGKRGLWGDWAEREAGGEIAHQGDAESVPITAQPVAVGA